ncbi:MAG: glucosamine-6-phosphate deaminase [Phycisphaerae bacterium]
MSVSHGSREKIPVQVFAEAQDASVAVAAQIADLIRTKATAGKHAVLGLATGSTPVGVYNELVRLHKSGQLSFKNVITFNLDEYFPMQRAELQSYWRFMHEHLFDHIDIDPKNIHIPDGTIPLGSVAAFCQHYEQQIADAGGLDLQILGIGRTGHIGFNEPGSARDSRTRLITLDRVTRLDAASDFFGEEHVPRRAITMGVGTILAAKQVVLIAFGEHKAPVIAEAVEGPITSSVAASFLQEHNNAQIILDQAAAAELTRFKTPWLVAESTGAQALTWDPFMTRKAVIWLAGRVKKPVLKLTNEDYNEHGLQDLIAARDSAYEINIDVFRELQETITGWPGGKPASEKRPTDISRPTDAIFPKRVIVFSPHPDDDVISMGGTLIRLADQGHEVHVAYQTSGNIAVFDADAIRFADFAADYNRLFGIGSDQAAKVEKHIEDFLRNKKPGQVDSAEVQQIKGIIRRGEARAAGRSCGIPVERLHFMDLPFYETGRVKKKPLGEEDVRITMALLEKLKPHQIYAAGDLSDPHGTHRVCLAAVLTALRRLKAAGAQWLKDCEIWLYRGAWQEWEPEKIEMAVPLSPDELLRKRMAIFKHQSQKDRAMFPGLDQREFWQRAEDRNRATARIYDRLGLAEYEAIEGFVKWDPTE